MSPRRILLAALALLLAPAAAFAQASPSPYTSGTRYDAMGHVTGTIAPDPDDTGPLHYPAVRNTYDPAGRLIRVETGELAAWQLETVAPAAWSGFSIFRTVEADYDVMGRKAQERVIEGWGTGLVRNLTQYSYDALGRLECTAVRMNPAAFGSLPPDACTLGTQGSEGPDRITRNVYDVWGEVLQVQRAYHTADEANEATYTYSANGRRTSVTDGNGNRAEMSWDGFDRQARWTFPSATTPGTVNASDYEEYGYDPNANRTSLRRRDGATAGSSYDGIIHYQYDALNRVTAKIVPERTSGPQILTAAQTRDVYYSYDNRNLQLSARFDSQSGEGIANAYDGFGRLASSTSTMGGTARTLSYSYDANGNRTAIKHPDEISFTTLYDGLNRPYLSSGPAGAIRLVLYLPWGPVGGIYTPANHSYLVYDRIGRPESMDHFLTGGDVHWAYGHNPANQLVSVDRDNDAYAWGGHYAVNRAYATNGLNQYSAAGGTSFTYDLNGNLTSDGANAYVYDVENRLVGASGLHNATLAYDPLGRLWRVTAPMAGGGTTTTQFLYDGDALVTEYNGVGVVTHRYAHWAGADVPMIAYDGADLSTARYLFADHQGSIIALANGAGALAGINSYDEYGIPAATNQGRFQYTGQAWLSELGLYYYKARVYSPTLGRFMQTDPIGYAGGVNLYGYVGDDPIDGTDPTGLFRPGSCAPDAHGHVTAACLETPSDSRPSNNSRGVRPAPNTVITFRPDEPLGDDLITDGVVTGLFGLVSSGVRVGLEALGVRLIARETARDTGAVLSRAILRDGSLNLSGTVARQLSRYAGEGTDTASRAFIPSRAIVEAISYGRRVADPQGVANQYMYTIGAGFLRAAREGRLGEWSQGTLEVLVNEATGLVTHVMYRRLP